VAVGLSVCRSVGLSVYQMVRFGAQAAGAAIWGVVAFLRRSRLRAGATGWGLYQDGQNPRLFIELFAVASWEEHLRQHRERLTGTDRKYHDDAAALSDPPPQTDHYLAADVHE
jgi:hypothetical protein